MLYTLENQNISIAVNGVGAELYSLKTKADGCEYLWQGESPYWDGRAYNLFPVCGRMEEGRYTYKGKSYDMPLHGFARDSEFSLADRGEDSITFELVPNDEIRKMYPFDFRYVVRYVLSGFSVRTEYEVHNTGDGELIFGLGGHPGFNVPLEEGERFDDYRIEFSDVCAPNKLVMSERLYTLREKEAFPLEGGRVLPLRHSMFDRDAIFLYNTSGHVKLCSKKSSRSVTVDYPDMTYLGFWHNPQTEAPFICIEPWISVPAYDGEVDDLETKRDMQRLDPGKRYGISFTITLGL